MCLLLQLKNNHKKNNNHNVPAMRIFLRLFQLTVCLVRYSTTAPCSDLFLVTFVKAGTLFPQTPFTVGCLVRVGQKRSLWRFRRWKQRGHPSRGCDGEMPHRWQLLLTLFTTTSSYQLTGRGRDPPPRGSGWTREMQPPRHIVPQPCQGGPFPGSSDHGVPLTHQGLS